MIVMYVGVILSEGLEMRCMPQMTRWPTILLITFTRATLQNFIRKIDTTVSSRVWLQDRWLSTRRDNTSIWQTQPGYFYTST